MCQICSSKKENVIFILDLLYSNCEKFFLPRKYEIYKKMKDYIKLV